MKKRSTSKLLTRDVNTLFAQALAQHQAGKLGEAIVLYEQILAMNGKHVDTLNNLGTLYLQRGHLGEGIQLIGRSLEINPNQPFVHMNRGFALHGLNRLEEALASYDRAISLKPDFAQLFYNRGNTLSRLMRLEEALASYDRAIALKPNFAEAYFSRGYILKDLNRLDEAVACYDRVIALKPDLAEAYYNRGNALLGLARMGEALVNYDRAIALKPDYADACCNRGNVLQDLRRYDKALASFDSALAIKPDSPYLIGSWLHCKMHCCDWNDIDTAYAKIANAVDLGEKASSPFLLLTIPSHLAQQQHCAQTYIRDKYLASSTPLWRGECYVHERIRIGYFSSDFYNHATAHLMAELFERHDRSRFEIIGFSFGPSMNDACQERLKRAFDCFLDVKDRGDEEIAALVRELEIDIAIDLKGHTQDARTGIFALHPAPVQVNYLGYPGTIGAEYIEYLIADPILIAKEHQQFYDEKIVYLPHSYQVNDSTKVISHRTLSRAELGLPENAFVFCCFNNTYKITPDLFDVWMRLLHKVEGSVLWLLEGNPVAVMNLRRETEKRGISPDRLVFAPRMELADHLARHRQADLFLDTFYCNAHTTASDALWAGLPVLTCLGDTFAGRVAASLLNAVGLPELITRSHAEYETLALELATQPERLAAIRQKLAANRTTQPLFDTARFTHHLEEAYMKMYERYQTRLSPNHIVVDA